MATTSPRPFDHLAPFNANLGPGGCSTEGGPGLFSLGGDICFQYGMINHITDNWNAPDSPYDQMIKAFDTGDYTDLECEPLPISANWVMKDSKRPFGEANLDWDLTHPDYHPYPRPQKKARKSRVTRKSASKDIKAVSTENSFSSAEVSSDTAAQVEATEEEMSDSMSETTSSSDIEDDNADGVSISSSDACMRRAINGETFEGEYEFNESSGTSSSGTSSDESQRQERKVLEPSSSQGTSRHEASRTSSPFDILRSSPATNMVSAYMAALSPPDGSVNLTRSYAVPVGPSKKKPVMKFTPTDNINGINMASFIQKLQASDTASGENIEIDDEAATVDRYVEMDLALGVLEEKEDQDIALRSDSSDSSTDESHEGDVNDAITHLTHIAAKGKDVKGKKISIEEL